MGGGNLRGRCCGGPGDSGLERLEDADECESYVEGKTRGMVRLEDKGHFWAPGSCI